MDSTMGLAWISMDLTVLQELSFSTTLLLSAIIFYVFYYFWNNSGCSGRLPPGPRGLPFVGYLPFLGKDIHLTFWKLSKTYGPIVRVKAGAVNLIVLNDLDSIKEGISMKEILNRPQNVLLEEAGVSGVVTLNGEAWVRNRRYCLHVLRNLGLGKKPMEQHIKEEILYLMERILQCNGASVLLPEYLVPSISNNITALVFGCRYSHDDPRRQFLDDSLQTVTKFLSRSAFVSFLPSPLDKLTQLPFTKVGSLRKVITKMHDFVRNEARLHKETSDSYHSDRDFIDGYLKKMQEHENDPESQFNLDRLVGNVINFFGAGSNTVQLSIQWHMLNCASRVQDIQVKIQKEIDEVIGKERTPAWEDSKLMPFTMATIWEMYRWRTIAPMGIPRCVSEDTYVGGYLFPAGSMVMPNLYAVHMNTKVWEDPEEFNPERFLKNKTELVEKPEHLIPFTLGKRMCPGETLATMEIFLYLASILQKFTVLPEETVDMRAHTYTASVPSPQRLRFLPR